MRRRPATAALIVPDEQTWAVNGLDPAALGLAPAFDLRAGRRLLLPERLAEPLTGPLATCLAGLPRAAAIVDGASLAMAGVPVETVLAGGSGDAVGHADHDHHIDHGEGGHGGMMTIVGEPSADGLVMERIDLSFGPLATPLPGGVQVDVTLDGDVVAAARVHALLEAPVDPAAPPDLLAPVAWRAALDPGTSIVRREVERATSHLAWLRSLARMTGWRTLVDACTIAVAGVRAAPYAPGQALPHAQRVLELVQRSRSFRIRAAGCGAIDERQARDLGLRGPNARASGLPEDARAEDPAYRDLGFEPVIERGGDVLARVLVRARELVAALTMAGLAAAAADRQPSARLAGLPVEGPRGPLLASRPGSAWQLAAPGAQAAREAAAAAMLGCEWSAALLVVASFDLSPWRVGE